MKKISAIDKNKKYLVILSTIRRNGGRVTEQRKKLIEIILKNPNATCKEIFYIAHETDTTIGIATVYRTVREIEKLGFTL